MVNEYYFETLDKTMRDILKFPNSNSLKQPFGREVAILRCDFRQNLPVISKVGRQEIVHTTINSSYL